MTNERTEKTLADYLVIAICPLLIMALVGSAAFLLLEITYHGQWLGRLRWTLFWFVLAAVLISRISIERGSASANVYGTVLALATAGQIYRLVGVTLAGWGLLGFIWWCTSRLTWDCTLVDDDEDASGEGLLQVAGLEKSTGEPVAEPPIIKKTPWWQWWRKKKPSGKPHAPGSWVIYFSLLALPVFGVAQAFFSTDDTNRRDYIFELLEVYLGAALCLLLATSFLGLRRYLRQRRLPMPATMAGLWIFLGTLLAGVIMVVCLALPRPDSTGMFSTWVNQVATEAAKQASKYAILTGTAAEGDGNRIGTGDGEGTDEQDGESGGKDGKPGGSDKQKGPGKSGQSGSKKQPGDKRQPNGKNKTNPATPSEQQSSQSVAWVASLVKWLIYGLVIGAILYLLYRHRREILGLLRALWASLLESLAWLFGWLRKKPKTADGAETFDPTALPLRFDSLTNPFTAGTSDDLSPEELVKATFDALQVWAAERDERRMPDETPLEFARRLGVVVPEIAEESRVVARLYTRVAYAEHQPPPECKASLAQLWEALEAANWRAANAVTEEKATADVS